MAIDLNKDNNELKYYYSENGSTLGPFSLSQLLEKIEADTLVYREGIDWTNARDVVELRKFFSSKAGKSIDKPIDKSLGTKKVNRLVILGVLILLGILGTVLFVFINKNLLTDVNSAVKPITAKIYANAKIRNKLVIGTLSIKEANSGFNDCMKNVFGDRLIKFSKYKKMDDALLDMENEETDILILNENEIKGLMNVLDISESMTWEGYAEDIYIAIPKNNETHLKSIQKCTINN
jgi:hypothetical protein